MLSISPAPAALRVAGWASLSVLGVGLPASTGAQATIWTVDSNSANLNACTAAPNDCSFDGAVRQLAETGDTMVFAVTSTSATNVLISKSVTIEANGARFQKINISRANGTADVIIRHAVWQDSDNHTGGIVFIGPRSTVLLEDVQFRRNGLVSGGGVAIHNQGHLTVRRDVFERNVSI